MSIERPESGTHVLTEMRIGVFGKGGAGKSTAVVLLAHELQDRGYQVCILDADSTNLGFPLVLGLDGSPEPLMKYFGGTVFSGGLVTCPVDDPRRLPGRELSLDELPPEYYRRSEGGITLLVAGKIGDQGPGAGCDGPVSKIARDLRITQRRQPLVTLVDLKAGFEDTARGVITGLDWAIVLVDPTVAAVEMAVDMRDTVEQIKNGRLPATQHIQDPRLVEMANQVFRQARIQAVLFILNKIRDPETAQYLEERLAANDICPDGILHEYPSISIAWLRGKQLQVPEAGEDIRRIVDALEAAARERR